MKYRLQVNCGFIALIVFVGFGCGTTSNHQSGHLSLVQDSLPYKTTKEIDLVWLTKGFDFSGFDALIITPTTTRGINFENPKDQEQLELAQSSLPRNLYAAIGIENIFPIVTLDETRLQPGAQVLRLDTTIVGFDQGNSAARYVLSYGAGMPYIRINGEARHDGQCKFKFQVSRKGQWFGTGFESAESIQDKACQELATELAEFMGQIARRETVEYLD